MPLSSRQTFAWLLAATTLLWLATGSALLAFTPLPAHTPHLGWTPLYWLVLAPASMLAGLRVRRLAATGARVRC